MNSNNFKLDKRKSLNITHHGTSLSDFEEDEQ